MLKTDGRNVRLKIEHGEEHLACAGVLLPQIATGLTLERTTETQWTNLKMVQTNRAYFFSESLRRKKLKSYFIKDDVVGVLSIDGEWLNVEFPREDKSMIKGWIKLSDTKDLLPPKN